MAGPHGLPPHHRPGHGHGPEHGHSPPHSPPRHGHDGHGPGHDHGPSHSPPRHGHGPAHSSPRHGHPDKHGHGDYKPKPKPGDGCSIPSGGNVQVVTIPKVVDGTTTAGPTDESGKNPPNVIGLPGDEAKRIVERYRPSAVVIVIPQGESGPDSIPTNMARLWLDCNGNVEFVDPPLTPA